ncbi:hypothetical protein ACFVKC_40670, partial [Streptomyces noursei]|uniref:hypothetical protein n=1 Tax=Streptomyces noursei TaxID=1971 RepID=UPI0036379AE7
GLGFTLEKLNNLFKEEVTVKKDFYMLKIIDYVMGIIDTSINEIINNKIRGYSDEVKEIYTKIYTEIIGPFFKVKFQKAEYRYSFLQTITPKEFTEEIQLNKLSEYKAFLEASDSIKQILTNLAKIVFNYKIEE